MGQMSTRAIAAAFGVSHVSVLNAGVALGVRPDRSWAPVSNRTGDDR